MTDVNPTRLMNEAVALVTALSHKETQLWNEVYDEADDPRGLTAAVCLLCRSLLEPIAQLSGTDPLEYLRQVAAQLQVHLPESE
jgi:hypothetical protein